MRFKILISIITCFTFLFTAAQTDDGRKSHIKIIKVKDEIYMLQGKGGNIGLSFGDDGIFMIDDQFEDVTELILEDIKKISEKPIQFLVNTHHHGDHTGGNANMAKTGTTIIAHENVRSRISEAMNSALEKATTANSKPEGVDPQMLPTITFSEDMTFYYNGEKIMVFHVHDAHTDGDVIVYFTESNVIHTGDVFFEGKYPYIDTASGGTLLGYMEALQKIMMLADDETKIIPGHGSIASKEDLRFTKNMLSLLYKRVTHHYMNLRTEDEITSMRDFTKLYDDKGFGDGFISTEKMLQIIYNEVKKERGVIDVRDMNERLREKFRQQKEAREKREKNG